MNELQKFHRDIKAFPNQVIRSFYFGTIFGIILGISICYYIII
jgi:hypothetical protein